jgi:putative membrane protein
MVMERNGTSPSALLGAAAGALGGLAGSWAMVRFNHLVGGVRDNQRRHPARRQDASPNEHDGTISDQPASMQVAELVSEPVVGRPLNEREKRAGSALFHYGFGAVAGALYGAAAERNPEATRAAGLPFGAAVWIVADEAALPLTGLAESPTEYPLSRHASALGSHLVFGLTVEGVQRLLRGSRHSG